MLVMLEERENAEDQSQQQRGRGLAQPPGLIYVLSCYVLQLHRVEYQLHEYLLNDYLRYQLMVQ